MLIKVGDLAAYDRFRHEAIARYAHTTEPILAERVVKVSLLAPTDRQMIRSLQPLAALAAESLGQIVPDDSVGMAAWRAFSLALMKYREGDDAGAVAMCERSMGYHFSNDALSVNRGVVLAMARFRLGQTDAARTELERCRKGIDAQRAGTLPYNWYWFDWVFADILLDEAVDMMGG